MSRDYVDDLAELGSENEYEEFNDTRKRRRVGRDANGAVDDSSEEEEDDDDEEAAAAIREGFIVDEDEDEDDEVDARERRRRDRKIRRAEREKEDAALDEEDLDLIGEANPELEQRVASHSKYKRLKRGHREDRGTVEPRGVEEIFSDDEEDVIDTMDRRRPGAMDDMEDFIEEDEFEDDIQRALEEEREVARPGTKPYGSIAGIEEAGLDEMALEDMRAAFGDGTEYDWALAKQQEIDEEDKGADRPLELKDVFEPEQLVDRLLTDEDNTIRAKDVPERFQLARKPFKEVDLSEDEMEDRLRDEALWIADLLLPKRRVPRYLVDPLRHAIRKVLEFMNIEDYEVPFIFQQRKDYLIHEIKESDFDPDDPDAPPPGSAPERLIGQDDLWEIFELDLRWRGLADKREGLQKTYESIKGATNANDPIIDELIGSAVSMEEVQDIHDYIHFQYSAQLKDINLMEAEVNGTQKRAQTANKSMFEQLRASKVYNFVRGFGITADGFAENVTATGRRQYTDDPTERPDDMADTLINTPMWSTGSQVLRAGRAMYIEELVMNPRLRKFIRKSFYENGMIDSVRTEKGLKKITEDHIYYEFKYLRNQKFGVFAQQPELYLRMLKAESEGLVEVKFKLANAGALKEKMYQFIESDNISEVADAWNALRREVVDSAFAKLEKVIVKGVKETLKIECENALARQCRKKLSEKVDQAPYKPRGMMLGTVPRVLALSNGKGASAKDAICWAWVEHDGRVLESGKFVDLRLGNPDKYIPDGKDVASLVELIQRRKPDVLAVSGFSVEAKKLAKDLQDLIERHKLEGAEYEDDGEYKSEKLEVLLVQDEVARLYYTSERASQEFPQTPPMTKYCVALARYVQSPLKEYASLGKNIISIIVDPSQSLIPQDKLLRYLETAMVDIVNLVGVDINDAVSDPYVANLLPFVSGLGVRKANSLLKTINSNGGVVNSRDELVGDPDRRILPAVGPKVFANCASFLFIEFDPSDPESDYMDNTRVHPEDYELARKMAGDAMDMDEEDVQGMTNDDGPGAVIRLLIREDKQDAVNDLVLEEYADQLEKKFNQRKRATLETIRAELLTPYEELRRNFALLSTDEIFTMLTGETRDSLVEGMIVPVQIKRIFGDHIEVKLDCGVEGGVSEAEYPEGVGGTGGVEPRQVYQVHQTVQAKILYINRKALTAQLSFREDALRRPYRKEIDHIPSEWDDAQEQQDKKNDEKEKEVVAGRAQRVVNHPLFFSFNSAQAEEYLGSKEAGEVVIRPSSKGPDHLAVTWKVADTVYQHIDVLELDKENEFSLGKTLKVGKYSYSDLDELIVNHVESMAKKVTEMMKDERYQKGSKTQTEQWLKTYTEANPKRSMYAFCINHQYPGYFNLCFKAGQNARLGSWPVKIVPNAYELQHYQYPDMKALKNGFKLLFTNAQGGKRR